jgi:hypothetical protein
MGSAEPSPLLRAVSPCTAGRKPYTKAKTRELLKAANPTAAIALFPNVPTMARSINAITTFDPKVMHTGYANLDIAEILSFSII